MKRLARGIGSLALLALLLVGAPMGLLGVGRLDSLRELSWSSLFAPTDSSVVLLGLLTLVAWIAWFLVVASTVAEVVALASRGRLRPRIPGAGWVQGGMHTLLIAVVAMVATVPLAATSARAASPSPAPASPSTVAAAPGHEVTARAPTTAASSPHVAGTAPAGTHRESAHHGNTQRHLVVDGDDLWSVAERYYGDGTRWRQIVRDNHLDPTDRLTVGSVLVLRDVHHAASQGDIVVVKQGDTLSQIAEDRLGDADRWPEIAALNQDLVDDPDQIDVGWRLQLPPRSPASTGSAAPTEPEPEGVLRATKLPAGAAAQHPGAQSRREPSTGSSPTSGSTTTAAGDSRPPTVQHTSSGSAGAKKAPGGGPVQTPGVESSSRRVPPSAAAPVVVATPTPTVATGTETDDPGSSVDGRTLSSVQVGISDDAAVAAALAAGSLLSAAVVAALRLRRRQQMALRSAGRRISLPSPESLRVEQAMGILAGERGDVPEAAATSVLLGLRDGQPFLLDVETARVTVVDGEAYYADAVLAAIGTGLALQPWSAETQVVVAGGLPWMAALQEPQVTAVESTDEGLRRMERLVATRRLELAQSAMVTSPAPVSELREDPDRWDAWAPSVFLFGRPLLPAEAKSLERLLTGEATGVSAIVVHHTDAAEELGSVGGSVRIEVDDGTRARLAGDAFIPHLLDPIARRALFELFEVAASDETTPAPWWASEDTTPPNLAVLPHRPTLHVHEEEPVEEPTVSHPTLQLLGPLDLRGCRGEVPARARRQCVEYCAWIQLNPGRTASTMARELLVAEGTRRSNMSRLRTWLGNDPNGEPYLPDAYSGRIQLHPAVTSDWEQLELMISGGVNRASTEALADALRLVRGAPLSDAAPGQWTWAEALRTDMISTIRDMAVVLVDRALTAQDIDLARWAASRGLRAAANDELLLCSRLRTEHLAGNRPEVERLVLQVTRSARQLGVDLRDETVAVLQEVMEGRRRAQLA